MKLRTLYVLLGIFFIVACNRDQIYIDTPLDQLLNAAITRASPSGSTQHFLLPEETDYASIPQDRHNPLTKEKVHLGKWLFFETGLAQVPIKSAGKKSYSCASCHVPTAGFLPGSPQGIADGGVGFGRNGETRTKMNAYREAEMDVQGLRPLSMLNVAFVKNTTWNGRFGSRDANINTADFWQESDGTAVNIEGLAALETQNIEGMDLHRMEITEEILDDYGYRPYFDKAFPDLPETERYTKRAASFAISAYLRSLLTNQAPFQAYLKGEKQALTEQEKKGALLFFGEARCYRCHKEANLGSNEFHAIGVKDLYETEKAFDTSIADPMNLGRGAFTDQQEDNFKFRVPQLYNLQNANFYFHGSSKTSIRAVIDYFNEAKSENAWVTEDRLSRQFKPLHLTTAQKEDLVAFIENGLFDPSIERYVPTTTLSGLCFPNNDVFSKIELGCQ